MSSEFPYTIIIYKTRGSVGRVTRPVGTPTDLVELADGLDRSVLGSYNTLGYKFGYKINKFSDPLKKKLISA